MSITFRYSKTFTLFVLIGLFPEQTISLEKLSEGIAASCCVLLVLNDETLDSQWCKHEVECARSLKIPITCILDADKQILRTVVDGYMQKGYGFLFDEQVTYVSTK